MKRLAIFASGEGTNAQNFIHYFKGNKGIAISLIVTNNPAAGVLQKAAAANIPSIIIIKEDFYKTNKVVEIIRACTDFIVLAGFMWMVPKSMIQAFPNKIVNIHPALLPKYGGKGMYGNRVHETVIAHKENESGITIHFVNEQYDEGAIIFQKTCKVEEKDTAKTLAARIHELEYKYYPSVVEHLLLQNIS